MNIKKTFHIVLLLFSLLIVSCTEPYALQTETFESALVIEATITDEYKLQEIKLSRTYRLEEDGPDTEVGAVVYVTDSNGNQYNFTASGDKYVSQQAFAAVPNVNYQLHIITADGKTYTSTTEKMSSLTDINELKPIVGTNQNGETGVQIMAKSTKTSENTEYYRFEYEETHKIIAPHWIAERGVAVYYDPPPPNPGDPPGYFYMEPWPYEAKICYTTEKSNEINISNTSLNSSNSSVNLVQFIKNNDYKIGNRYSIEVTMYNESLAANNYFEALKMSASNGNLLSQNQPGFFSGNIKNATTPTEKVIGFFDVVHVSKQRIFFNYEDVFPNQQKPDYPYYCPQITTLNENDFKFLYCFCPPGALCPTNPSCSGDFILGSIRDRIKSVYRYGLTEVQLVNIQCGDCTSFSSNIRPPFWVD
ncbi:DUF4249 domain-containing protein [Flavobacterium sp. GCM10027622]|uniref:DUF4249 domain-containing protein n=1 Tax=unclassified Flavobacterium TaxID=196869 RepID=UPI0036205922